MLFFSSSPGEIFYIQSIAVPKHQLFPVDLYDSSSPACQFNFFCCGTECLIAKSSTHILLFLNYLCPVSYISENKLPLDNSDTSKHQVVII